MFQEFYIQTIYIPDIFKFPSLKKADTGRQANTQSQYKYERQ